MMKKSAGLTLLELVIAVTIMSFVLLASTSFNLSTTRMTSSASEESRLRNELTYVFRKMEADLQDGKNTAQINAAYPYASPRVTNCDIDPTVATVFISPLCLEVKRSRGDLIRYKFDFSSQTLSYETSVAGYAGTPAWGGETIVSKGILVPYAVLKDYNNPSDVINQRDKDHIDTCLSPLLIHDDNFGSGRWASRVNLKTDFGFDDDRMCSEVKKSLIYSSPDGMPSQVVYVTFLARTITKDNKAIQTPPMTKAIFLHHTEPG